MRRCQVVTSVTSQPPRTTTLPPPLASTPSTLSSPNPSPTPQLVLASRTAGAWDSRAQLPLPPTPTPPLLPVHNDMGRWVHDLVYNYIHLEANVIFLRFDTRTPKNVSIMELYNNINFITVIIKLLLNYSNFPEESLSSVLCVLQFFVSY